MILKVQRYEFFLTSPRFQPIKNVPGLGLARQEERRVCVFLFIEEFGCQSAVRNPIAVKTDVIEQAIKARRLKD